MDVICIVAFCDCEGIVIFNLKEEDPSTSDARCKGCKKLYRIDKLPLIDEIIEHDE